MGTTSSQDLLSFIMWKQLLAAATSTVTMICPVELENYNKIVMAHGGGGRVMNELVSYIRSFLNITNENYLNDSAILQADANKIAFTSDSFVVSPLFFSGGDIGKLAVCGTVNDLAMGGAMPKYLSLSFILEEGFAIEKLSTILQTIKDTVTQAGVQIVTGDTKVVEKGKCDGIFINTSGIGFLYHQKPILPTSIKVDDAIILSGDIARHGLAVLSKREGIEFEADITSDCAPLNHIVKALLDANIDIHCMRDLTRGGLGSALVELSNASGLSFFIEEACIPIQNAVKNTSELLGFDPLYIANEGRFVLFVDNQQAMKTCEIMKQFTDAKESVCIGKVEQNGKSVTMKTVIGTSRAILMLSGEQLPRIC